MGPARAAGCVHRRGIGTPRRPLQVGRDAPVRSARRLGRHRARARREAAAGHALLPPRVARGAVAQAPARAARDEPRAAHGAAERRVRRVHRRHDRARETRRDHREARGRVPGAHPAQDRGVHVSPQQHEHDHRRADDAFAQVRAAGRVRRLARRRDADPVAHRDARARRPGHGAPSQAREADVGRRWHRRPRLHRLARTNQTKHWPRRSRREEASARRGTGPRRSLRSQPDHGRLQRSPRRATRAVAVAARRSSCRHSPTRPSGRAR